MTGRIAVAAMMFLQVSAVNAAGKYLWAELIAFDNSRPDFGVGEYLSRMPEKPNGISFLLFDPEIVHSHDGLQKDFPIGDLHCAYYGRPFNEERGRQDWTAWQLRGLVSELAKRGIESYPSFFDLAPGKDSGLIKRFNASRKDSTWVDRHPEVRYQLKDGKYVNVVCPLKRMANGSFYEDFLAGRLVRFLKDYGFAGFHAADGYGHPRFALCDGDFSDDILEQFSSACPDVKVPGGQRKARAEWILSNARAEWSRFYAVRQAAFIGKIAKALHAEGLTLRANTCWTCDPHTALFRYGVDYRKMVKAGVDAFFTEVSATVLELENWRFSDISVLDRRRATILRLAPSVSVPLVHLACVKDGLEEYNALRHAPAMVEAEILALASLSNNGRKALPHVLWCLSDGITASEWAKLDALWRLLPSPAKTEGVRVVWSDRAADAELDAYCAERYPSSYSLLSRLLQNGAVIGDAVRVEDALKNKEMPLLVLNPGCFPAEELAALGNRKVPVVKLGKGAEGCVFGSRPSEPEPGKWLHHLPVRELPASVLKAAVGRINSVAAAKPYGSGMNALRLVSYVAGDSSRIVVALNDKPVYLNARFTLRGCDGPVEALTESPSLPVGTSRRKDGEILVSVKIPPSGVVALTCGKTEKSL